jgi:hypothetical protein
MSAIEATLAMFSLLAAYGGSYLGDYWIGRFVR